MPDLINRVFHIKQGDTLPIIQEELSLEGTDLSSATAVQFHLVDKDGAEVVNEAGAIVSTAAPLITVEYAWSGGDLDTATGLHFREWELTFPGATILTVPNAEDLGYPTIVAAQGA